MARLHDGRRALRGYHNRAAMITSDQDDIDSHYMPSESDHDRSSMISVTESVYDLYDRSHSGRGRAAALGDRHIGDESAVESETESENETDSEECYRSEPSVNENDNDDRRKGKYDDAIHRSPRGVSDPLGESKEKKGFKRGGIFGRIFGGKVTRVRDGSVSTLRSNKSSKNRRRRKSNSIHSDSEHDRSESQYDQEQYKYQDQSETQSFSVVVFDDNSQSPKRSYPIEVESDFSHSESYGQYDDDHGHRHGHGLVEVVDSNSNSTTNTASSWSESTNNRTKRHTQEERRKMYEGAMPGVTEEAEGNESSEREYEYRSNKYENGDQENVSPNSVLIDHEKKKIPGCDEGVRRTMGDDPPDNGIGDAPDSPKVKAKKSKSFSSSHHSRKGKKKKKKRDSQPSTAAVRDHGAAVNSRIDHTGQISKACGPVAKTPVSLAPDTTQQQTVKLRNEVYRLRTLLELMMTRMELYERQSECLIEAATEDHTREWKVARIEKKRNKKSPVDEQLSNVKNLLVERSAQDKWIRQLEGIEREYQERLATTQKQLRSLRYDHIATKLKIIDLRKDNVPVVDSGNNTEITPEKVIGSNKNDNKNNPDHSELLTPIANNVALSRWTGEARVGESSSSPPTAAPPPNAEAVPGDGKPGNPGFVGAMDPEGRKITALLQEMIVSWHSTETDMSPLSIDGEKKKDKKKDKKKKKKKKDKKIDTGEIL